MGEFLELYERGEELKRLRSLCGSAYQVVGSLASDLGVFDTEEVTRVLNCLSDAANGDKEWRSDPDDMLPFPSFEEQITPEHLHSIRQVAIAVLEDQLDGNKP